MRYKANLPLYRFGWWETMMISTYLPMVWPVVASTRSAATSVPAENIDGDTVEADIEYVLSARNRTRLEEGEILTIRKLGRGGAKAKGCGRVIGLINRPWTEVWEHLIHEREYPYYMPHLTSVETYFSEKNRVGILETTRIAFMTFRLHVIMNRDKRAKTISWELDTTQANDIAFTAGSWVLRPVDRYRRCLAVYTLDVESKNFVPSAVVDFLLDAELPAIVRALKEHAEANPFPKKGSS
jgi:hypothetical protein